jgi:nitrite reductase/ring-hydroxylating ferredoxin subunit
MNANLKFTIEQSNETSLTQSLLTEGKYLIVKDFPEKDNLHIYIKECILEGIEEIVDTHCMRKVKEAGLSKMHNFFPVEKLPLLHQYVENQARERIHRWAYIIGSSNLGIAEDFWLNKLFILRIHYPFNYELKSPTTQVKGDKRKRFLKRVFESVKKQDIIPLLQIPREIRENLCRMQFANQVKHISDFNTYKGIETAAVHAPHLDIWYGLPFNGVTLWWSIEGVTENNGLILYPELFGVDLQRNFEGKAGQMQAGIVLPKPHKIALDDGDILIFSQEKMYHATQLNVSDMTRVVISTHINIGKPRFSPKLWVAFENFYSSNDIRQGLFKPQHFPSAKNLKWKKETREKPLTSKPLVIKIKKKLYDGLPIAICTSKTLIDSQKMLVNLADTSLIIGRNSTQLFCLSSLCPHQGYNMIYGAHDEERLYCPGHGVDFKISDGSSLCEGFKLKVHKIFEDNGIIYVERGNNVT